jgi:hypothetical protein
LKPAGCNAVRANPGGQKAQEMNQDKPLVPEVAQKIKAYLSIPGNEIGGNLHLVLQNGNIQDKHVLFCKQQATESGDSMAAELADTLLKMSKTQRLKPCSIQ